MNIILTGMRGSGKSSVGRSLARKLGWDFVDMDYLIEEKCRMQIKDMVDLKGWAYFRDKEHLVAKEVAEMDNVVIATGGGALMFERNVEVLKKTGKVVLLECDIDVCSKRIGGDENRPSLGGVESSTDELKGLWEERKERYFEVADIVVDGSVGGAGDVAEEVYLLVKDLL